MDFQLEEIARIEEAILQSKVLAMLYFHNPDRADKINDFHIQIREFLHNYKSKGKDISLEEVTAIFDTGFDINNDLIKISSSL